MCVSTASKIKFPSLVHAGVAGIVCLCFSLVTVHVVEQNEELGGLSPIYWVGMVKLSAFYGLLLFYAAVVKLLQAQHFLLKEKSFFLSAGVVPLFVYLMCILSIGGVFIPYIGMYSTMIVLLIFIGVFYFIYAGLRRLGVSGKWVLFYYVLAIVGPMVYLFLWRMMGGNNFRIVLFHYILFFLVELIFIWQVRRILFLLQKKELTQDIVKIPV